MNRPFSRRWMRALVFAMTLVMVGCAATPPLREPAAVPGPAAATIAKPPVEAAPAVLPPAASPTPERSPWKRLRNRFAMPGCAYDAAVLKQARFYTRSKLRFSENWRRAMPFLLLVLNEIERRDLPGEFALLPYVESHYRPVPARQGGPAGLWQLMPRTAIDRGLRVGRNRDERLDPVDSTRVALDLLERLDRQFSDWRLTSMAFNAGEFRIKRALGGRRGTDLSAEELGRLSLSPTTHQHLARLLALACIVSEPERFDVRLPPADANDTLAILEVPSPLDPRLAAALAGIPLDELLRYNPAASPARSIFVPLNRVLLPATMVNRFNAGLAEIPPGLREHWTTQHIDRATPLATMAANLHVPVALLAAANGLAADAELRRGQTLFVPQTAAEPSDEPAIHVIRSGDTLSEIAGHYGVALADLLKWNSLERKSKLRLGARLRIRAPEY